MMSSINPTIPVISNPIGIDKPIQEIQIALSAGLPWLKKSFGRAWMYSERDPSGKVQKYPKCYCGGNDYLNVLPNDQLISQSFFSVRSPEKVENFNREGGGNHKTREVSIIFWGNLKKIDGSKSYIYTEELKKQVEMILIQHENIQSINAYYDEKADDIFAPFTLNDVEGQYLVYPLTGFKFDVTIKYFDQLC